jgi:DNA-binding PadR family transcriptional regulator
MNKHQHIPRPFDDVGRRAHHEPFVGPWGDPRQARRAPFAGGPGFCGPGGVDPRQRYHEQFGGPGQRGGRPPFGPGFGPEGPFGPGGPGGFRRGWRAGRGDIRAAILLLLAEQPRHGYDLIREIADRTDGAWTPSPGAIYPALSLLEDEGLVTIAAEGGRKLASLSDEGRAYVTDNREELGDPFGTATARTPKSRWALREALHGIMGASMQVAQTANDEQLSRALAVLDQARKDLYRVLAEDQPTTPPAAQEA